MPRKRNRTRRGAVFREDPFDAPSSAKTPDPRVLLPRLISAAALALAFACTPALAQTKPGEIKGVDAMGDKSRSANDGWSQAPVPREESAAKDAPDPGGRSTSENRDRNVPGASTGSSSGTEPQAPLPHRTPGPSGENPAAPSK